MTTLHLHTVHDLAATFRCSEESVAELFNTGQLPGLKIGRSWVAPHGALVEGLDRLATEHAARLRELRKPVAPTTVDLVGRQSRVPPRLP